MELTRARFHELSADEEPVALLEPNDVPRLGRGRIIEARRDGRAVLFAFELSQA